ncbi:MAG: allose kinase [Clostridia bacterium]|nr:allose kinase [Clostridia bacterium]
MQQKEVLLCMDIGGTNCRMGLCDRDYALCEKKIVSTEQLIEQGFATELVALIRSFLSQYQKMYTVRGISLGFPATIDREKRIVLQAPAIPGVDGFAACDLLEKEFELPVFLEKDVIHLMRYDLNDLRLPLEGLLIGIYFGTGIGNAIFWNGKPYAGRNGVAGELGHIPQMNNLRSCSCGNIGCLEPFGGGKRLTELCQTEFADTPVKTVYREHLFAKSVQQQIDAMAIAVATEVNILDPDCVVLGGGLLQMEGFPVEQLETRIRSYVRKPYPERNLRLVYSKPNQENGIIGAGICGWEKLSYSV